MNIFIAVALAGLVREKIHEEGDVGWVGQHGVGSIKQNSSDKEGDFESLGDIEKNRPLEKDEPEIDASKIGDEDVDYKTVGEASRVKRQARRHRKHNSFMKMRFGRSTNENFQDQETSRF